MLRLLQETWRHHQNPPLKWTIWRGDWHLSAASESELLKEELVIVVIHPIYVKLFSDDMVVCLCCREISNCTWYDWTYLVFSFFWGLSAHWTYLGVPTTGLPPQSISWVRQSFSSSTPSIEQLPLAKPQSPTALEQPLWMTEDCIATGVCVLVDPISCLVLQVFGTKLNPYLTLYLTLSKLAKRFIFLSIWLYLSWQKDSSLYWVARSNRLFIFYSSNHNN